MRVNIPVVRVYAKALVCLWLTEDFFNHQNDSHRRGGGAVRLHQRGSLMNFFTMNSSRFSVPLVCFYLIIMIECMYVYNKIGLTKVLKYNFADIVTGILPKNHFYGSYLGFCVLSNFFGTLRQTPIWQTRQSDKHKRKSGRQENPTNSGQRQSDKQDNLTNNFIHCILDNVD